MTVIPEGVMKTGRDVLDACHIDDCTIKQFEEMATIVAIAIIAERERCALIAKAFVENISASTIMDDEPELIYQAIMEGSK